MRTLAIMAIALVLTPLALAGFGAVCYGFWLAGVELNNALDIISTDAEGLMAVAVAFALWLVFSLVVDDMTS